MRKYLSVFRIRLINGLQYRSVALADIFTRLVWSGMEILAFLAVYRSAGTQLPMTFEQTVSYVWIQQTFLILFSVVHGDYEIFDALRSGSIAYELVRPASLYGRWFCQAAANRLSLTVINFMPTLLIALVLPAPFRLVLPDALRLLLFVVSALLALAVVVAFAMLMYVALFYTVSQRGVRVIVTAITGFLSGGIVPLPFFPEGIRQVVEALPFAAMQNMPLQIFSGTLTGTDALWGIAFQIVWLAVLVLAGQLWMKHALGRVVVQGG